MRSNARKAMHRAMHRRTHRPRRRPAHLDGFGYRTNCTGQGTATRRGTARRICAHSASNGTYTQRRSLHLFPECDVRWVDDVVELQVVDLMLTWGSHANMRAANASRASGHGKEIHFDRPF